MAPHPQIKKQHNLESVGFLSHTAGRGSRKKFQSRTKGSKCIIASSPKDKNTILNKDYRGSQKNTVKIKSIERGRGRQKR